MTRSHCPTRSIVHRCRRKFPAALGRVVFLSGLLVTARLAGGQQSTTPPDPQTVQMLLQRIDQLEARVRQLEEAKGTGSSATSAQQTEPSLPSSSSQESEPDHQEEPMGPERMDLSKTLLRIRGFGDITFHGDNSKGDTTSFTLGQLDLFVTSDVSEKFKFLSEIVFEAGPEGVREGNSFGVDLERYLLQYTPSEYFNLSVGRFHTAIGYYNTAYHHSTWFQTTTGRPFLFAFEDEGGILPVHTVGASVAGRIPSGSLGLHYVAEVGNGRTSGSLLDEPVQNAVDENNHKAFNLALFARPKAVNGLQFGFSAYRDVLTPSGSPRIGETILAAHAVYSGPTFEWLNEAVVVRHTPESLGHTFNTPAFYSQLSKRFGSYRPYFRYQYMNASGREPIFSNFVIGPQQGIGLRQGPSVGLRYDASDSVAVKLQYDYTALRQQQAINALALQVGFTF